MLDQCNTPNCTRPARLRGWCKSHYEYARVHGFFVVGRHEWHGHEGSRTYHTWAAMIQRCTNPRAGKWKDYGGRGITICERWRNSYGAFFADMGERPENKTLDRIDNNGNYEPGNCRWATPFEQVHNRRPKVLTHCKNGHAMDDANTFVNTAGWHVCRACSRAKTQRHRDMARLQAKQVV